MRVSCGCVRAPLREPPSALSLSTGSGCGACGTCRVGASRPLGRRALVHVIAISSPVSVRVYELVAADVTHDTVPQAERVVHAPACGGARRRWAGGEGRTGVGLAGTLPSRVRSGPWGPALGPRRTA